MAQDPSPLSEANFTIEILAEVANTLLQRGGISATEKQCMGQSHVDINLPVNAVKLPLEDFTQAYIKPAITKLINFLPSMEIASSGLSLPKEFLGAICSVNKLQVRVLFTEKLEFESTEDSFSERYVIRFDVRHPERKLNTGEINV